MTRVAGLALAVVLAGCAAQRVGPRLGDEPYGPPVVADVLVGARLMDDEALWSPLDDQLDLGFALRTPLGPGPLHGAFGARYAFDDASRGDADLEAQTIDLSAGFDLVLGERDLGLHPFVGAGAALVFVDTELDDGGTLREDRDAAFGGYVRGGFVFEFRPAQHVGIELRRLIGTDASIDGLGADLEATTVAFVFGARF